MSDTAPHTPDTVYAGVEFDHEGEPATVLSCDWMNGRLWGVYARTAAGEHIRIPGGLFTLGAPTAPARPRPETLADMLTAAAYALDAPVAAAEIKAGDLVEATIASTHPRTITVQVDRTPWKINDRSTVLCTGTGEGPVAVLTDTMRVLDR